MNDEQRRSGPDQPRAETSGYHQAEKLAFENKMLRAVLDSMPDNISIKEGFSVHDARHYGAQEG